MSTDLEKGPGYRAVLEALIEKTKAGKLNWQETADENMFLAAVRGERTFEIRLVIPENMEDSASAVLLKQPGFAMAVLTVRDRAGRLLFATPLSEAPLALELYELARRIAMNVDEQIDATVELLNQI